MRIFSAVPGASGCLPGALSTRTGPSSRRQGRSVGSTGRGVSIPRPALGRWGAGSAGGCACGAAGGGSGVARSRPARSGSGVGVLSCRCVGSGRPGPGRVSSVAGCPRGSMGSPAASELLVCCSGPSSGGRVSIGWSPPGALVGPAWWAPSAARKRSSRSARSASASRCGVSVICGGNRVTCSAVVASSCQGPSGSPCTSAANAVRGQVSSRARIRVACCGVGTCPVTIRCGVQ